MNICDLIKDPVANTMKIEKRKREHAVLGSATL